MLDQVRPTRLTPTAEYKTLAPMEYGRQLHTLFAFASPDENWFHTFVYETGSMLKADRCFIYMRHPHKRLGRTRFCWIRSADIPTIYNHQWIKEDPTILEHQDPLFAAALEGKPSVYVPDVEAASPEILNVHFERKYLGHRALIHAHLHDKEGCWGVFQPSVFHQSRVWSEEDHQIVSIIEEKLTPLVRDYVKAHATSGDS